MAAYTSLTREFATDIDAALRVGKESQFTYLSRGWMCFTACLDYLVKRKIY